jgi:ketosteroid isomerase-like protein
MSEENVELVRRYYAALNRGDQETVRELLTEDFVTDTSRRPVEPAVLRGREASMTAAAAVREVWEELIVEPVELIPSGDRVLAIVDNRGRGRSSGAAVESRTGQLWTLRDGKLARFEYFGTREEALRVLGLSE